MNTSGYLQWSARVCLKVWLMLLCKSNIMLNRYILQFCSFSKLQKLPCQQLTPASPRSDSPGPPSWSYDAGILSVLWSLPGSREHCKRIKTTHLSHNFRSVKSWKTIKAAGQSLTQCLIHTHLYWHQETNNLIIYSNSSYPRTEKDFANSRKKQREHSMAVLFSALLIIAWSISLYWQCTMKMLFSEAEVYHLWRPWKHTFNPVHLDLTV